jgi:hypothetical protein
MAGQTLALFDDVLKYDYLPTIRKQINGSTVLLSRLEKNEEDIGGKNAVVALHVGRNSGIGATGDGGALPTAGRQQYDNALYKVKYNYGRMQLTGPTIAAARKDKYAFVRATDSELKGTVEDMKDDVNRQLFGDGTGTLALVNGDPGTASTTLTVDNPGTMYFSKGMIIDIVDPASTTAGDARGTATGLTVSAKASATTLTMSAILGDAVADNDVVCRKGNYLNEMMGIKGIISDSDPRSAVSALDVGGINRATAGNEFWKANVVGNSGTARKLTLDLMQYAWDMGEEEGGEVTLILTSRTQRRKYLALVKADGRFVNTMKLDGGFDALEYNGKPLVVEKYCPPDLMYFMDESTMAFYRMSDFEWMQSDGAILSRISGYDAYEAVLYIYATLGCGAPNKNTVLKDLISS